MRCSRGSHRTHDATTTEIRTLSARSINLIAIHKSDELHVCVLDQELLIESACTTTICLSVDSFRVVPLAYLTHICSTLVPNHLLIDKCGQKKLVAMHSVGLLIR